MWQVYQQHLQEDKSAIKLWLCWAIQHIEHFREMKKIRMHLIMVINSVTLASSSRACPKERKAKYPAQNSW